MSRNKFWILGVGCLLLAAGLASAADAPVKKPRAVVPESYFTFQTVLEGTEVTHAFVIQNSGEAPLNIIKVSAG